MGLPSTLAEQVGLIIAPELDVHAFAVRRAASQLGREILVLDAAEFPQEFDLIANFGGDGPCGCLQLKNGNCIDLSRLSGLWWRRTHPPATAHLVNPAFSEASTQELRQALFGSLNAFVSRAFNDVGRSRVASQKALQLSVAKEIGFEIPRTLITNNPKKAREFYVKLCGW